MGKNTPKVCGVCGKMETTHWSYHNKRHNDEKVLKLLPGNLPPFPWCPDWYERLPPELQERYKDSDPKKVN